jgi:hypothetical protein
MYFWNNKETEMTKSNMIEKTLEVISQLPEDKINEVSDFADYLLKKHENSLIVKNIADLTTDGETFKFLEDCPDIYSEKDLKVIFNAKG